MIDNDLIITLSDRLKILSTINQSINQSTIHNPQQQHSNADETAICCKSRGELRTRTLYSKVMSKKGFNPFRKKDNILILFF
jgi:hypothetical protein